MKSLERVDRWIGKHFERWSANLAGGDHPKETLEIRREILTAIGDKVEAKGGGEYVFPYSEITVKLFAQDADRQAALEASFADEDALQSNVRDMLRDAGCAADSVTVKVEAVVEPDLQPDAQPFQLTFKRLEKPAKGLSVTPAKVRPAAWLYVVKGSAERPEYFIGKDVFYVGRLKEVSAKLGGLRRRNDVAFDDAETSVSREHAHIHFEEGKFRLFHDSGEAGTRIFRDGHAVALPATGTRGTQLRSGDEIHLGDARLRFEVGE